MNIIFFGSTSDSVLVLTKLIEARYHISAVVTQPPTPVGRKQIVTPTPVKVYATTKNIPVLSFRSDPEKPWKYQCEQDVINSISTFKPELLVSASYGQKIPQDLIYEAKSGGLNVHPSLLPRWRGADPVPWTILSGDRQTGVTVVTLSRTFDQGKIIAQKKVDLKETEVADKLRATLFGLGAELLVTALPEYLSGKNKGTEQHIEHGSVARKLTRDDGFEEWDAIRKSFTDGCEATRIFRKYRAFLPWPGLWTLLRPAKPGFREQAVNEKRLKILAAHVENNKLILDSVQLEGKTPIGWKQFVRSYIAK